MPTGSGGQVCTHELEVKALLRTEPAYGFEIMALDVSANSTPEAMTLTLAQFSEPDKQIKLQQLFGASSTGKVAVQWPPTS